MLKPTNTIYKKICLLFIIINFLNFIFVAGKSKEIFLAVLLHYSFYIYLVLFSKPETSVSIGYHQRTGPCGVTVPVHTPFGMVRLYC